MEFKVNNCNLNNNIDNKNEKFIRRKKRHETFNSMNNLFNSINDNYFDVNSNDNKNKDDKENKRNIHSIRSNENIFKNKDENLINNDIRENKITEINVDKTKNKEDNSKEKKILNSCKNKTEIIKQNENSALLNFKDKLEVKNINNELNKKNSNISSNKFDDLKVINNNNIILSKKEAKEENKEVNKKDIKEDKEEKFNNEEKIIKDNQNKKFDLQNKKEKKEDILEKKDQEKIKEKQQIISATVDSISITDSFYSFYNNNILAGTEISERNISNISIPMSYNLNNVKCNKFSLNDICQDENDNKIIKELASELEQSTTKKIKKLGSQKKRENENFEKKIIQNIKPINLIQNLKNDEIVQTIKKNDNNQYKSQSHKKIEISRNTTKIEKNETFSEEKQSQKININKLLNNNKLKSLINQENESINLNNNSEVNVVNNNNTSKNENELIFKSNNNSEYANENNYHFYFESSPESINRKLFLFNQKLYDIENYMKEKFIEIIKQIDSLKHLNIKKYNNTINPYRTCGFRTDENVFNTINNDIKSIYNFSMNGRDENINYINLKSPRFEIYSQLFPYNGIKSLKKYNYFKDSILIDNLNRNQNKKNEEISAIKKFIEKKINVNNGKTLYKDFSKRYIKGISKNKNSNIFNSINGDVENNENMLSKINNNKSTITANEMKWIDLKVLANKKLPKKSSNQKLKAILSGENKNIK